MVSQLIGAVGSSVPRLMNNSECLTGSWFYGITVNNTVEPFSHSAVAVAICVLKYFVVFQKLDL